MNNSVLVNNNNSDKVNQ